MDETFRTPYPNYDVLAKWDSPSWNDITRQVVSQRLTKVPCRRFFTLPEWELLHAICDRLIPQPDRPEPVPIVPWIDQKLHRNQGDGYRYADMPTQREAWRQGLAAIADEAELQAGAPFARLAPKSRDHVLRSIQDGHVRSRHWRGLPPKRFFTVLLLNEVAGIYYSHPAAWSEIGYGGPASPRGYVRMDFNRSDPWEAHRP